MATNFTYTIPTLGNSNITESQKIIDALTTIKTGAIVKISSTDNAIVRFDGTEGSVQNSLVTISDTGVVGGVTQLIVNGTDDGSGAKLQVNGNVHMGGNVLIGTKYEITTGAGGGNANLAIGSTGNTFVGIKAYQANVNYVPIFSLGKSHSNVDGTLATTPSGSYLGMAVFDGVNSGNTVGLGAGIVAYQNGSAGSVYVPTDLIFNVSDGITYGEALKINKDKTIKVANLAGVGNRMMVVGGDGVVQTIGVTIDKVVSSAITSTSFINSEVTRSNLLTIITVGFYNTLNGSQGHGVFLWSGAGLTQIALVDATGCGVAFQANVANDTLQYKVTNGSVIFDIKKEVLT